MDYIKLYNLEDYLFSVVTEKFNKNGYLDAFDFFCIIIWKANRAKSKTAKRLIQISGTRDLDKLVRTITSTICEKGNAQERLLYLLDTWRFRLPMASAILTVLYPNVFTVYDVRVCDMLRGFHKVQNKSLKKIWNEYLVYVDAVKKAVPGVAEMRDKDRYLWGKSFCEGLTKDLSDNFAKPV